MFKELLIRLKYLIIKPDPKNGLGEFLAYASKKEQAKFYMEVSRRSTLAQRAIIEKYNKMVESGEVKGVDVKQNQL
jgi:hypothetical protein